MLVDTHAHIYLEHFKEDLETILFNAQSEGINKILMPNIDSHTIEPMLELEQRFGRHCEAMIGLHPCSVDEDYQNQLKLVENWLQKRDFRAVGEIGTDLYWDKTFWKEQKKAFKWQCALASEYKKPIVIHCRETLDQTIKLVGEFENGNLTGVFHCFTGSEEQAFRIIDLGFFLGIGGVATFKNGGLDKVLPKVGLQHLILETDSPYLAPVPFRGKRNQPAYLKLIAQKVSKIKDISLDELAQQTTNNAFQLFNLR